jgi:hypothetical protein
MIQSMPGDGGGSAFAVDPATLTGVAGTLGQSYDELNDALAALITPASLTGGDFGDPGVAAAWNSYWTACQNEFSDDVAAVQELIDNLIGTADNYLKVDESIASSFYSVGER